MDTLINDGEPFLVIGAASDQQRRSETRRLLDAHVIRRVFQGVYVDTRVPDCRALRTAAVRLVMPPEAVFYGATAAFLMGVDVFSPRDRFNFVPQCVVPHHSSRCDRLFVRCVEGYLPSADLIEIDGLLTTNAVRTTVDLLRTHWRPYALAAADSMAHAGLVTKEEVQAYIADLRRYPGIVQARQLVALVDSRVESPGESWQRLRLVDSGFAIPEPQIQLFDRFGNVIFRLDNGYREAKVGSEFDGREFHTENEDQEHDRTRRDLVTSVFGWRLLVARREDIFGDDPAFEIQIGQWLGIPPRLPRPW